MSFDSTYFDDPPRLVFVAGPLYVTTTETITTSATTRKLLSGTFEHCQCGCRDLRKSESR